MSDEFHQLPQGGTHNTLILSAPNGLHCGICQTCGDRMADWEPLKGECIEWCDKHERDSRAMRLNTGPRPSPKTLLRYFRDKQEQGTYTRAEQAQWKQLADELEERINATDKKQQLEGQLSLFDETGG